MPTLRQQLAIQKISDFIRNPQGNIFNMGKILEESGYSSSVCKKPHLIVKSTGFQAALNTALADLDLCTRREHLFLIQQDANLQVKAKAIDMYFKLTGQYQTSKPRVSRTNEIDEALEKIRKLVK